jgi:chemosensory pili system protein ChpA (sensor histidine kinase/response regulator)
LPGWPSKSARTNPAGRRAEPIGTIVPDASATPDLHLLVVSDDQSVMDEFEFGSTAAATIEFASDAREAWNRLVERVPLAVIVDLQSGSAGGFALARDMKADGRFADIPVVILLERDQDAWLARQAGALFYRTKPVEADRVITDIIDAPSRAVQG